MVAAEHLPLTNAALSDLVDGQGFYRVPASLSDYWDLLAEADYRADYYDHHLIASMSYESDIHSRIANRIAHLLFGVYMDDPNYVLYNSNRPIYIESCRGNGTGVFNADGMVVQVPRQPFEYKKGVSAETNPVLLIEVLSPSTRSYDFGTKLPCYKQVPSLQTILFLEQDKPLVTVMERQAPNQWTDTTYAQLTDSFSVAGASLTLGQIYRGVYA